MRTLFENKKVTEIFYKGFNITMNEFKCFVVRNASNNFLALETSNTTDYDFVRNFIENLTKNK